MKVAAPLGDRVSIIPDEAETQTGKGLVIPETSREKPKRGRIDRIGESPLITLKPGDEVLYGKISGTEVIVEGRTYVIMRQADVLCKLEEA